MAEQTSLPRLEFDPNTLPLGQLESLRFKINQIIDSIQNLQRTIEFGVQTSNGFIPNALPPWPDILAKYNLLVSQAHTLSNSLAASFAQPAQSNPSLAFPGTRPKPQPSNPFEKLALHPSVNLTETQFDNDLVPLLRSQQTVSVLNNESMLVARIQESIKELSGNMNGISRLVKSQSGTNQPDHERTIRACETIRSAHDARVDRARRAVTMLRDKYDWRARVEITFPVTPPPEISQLAEGGDIVVAEADQDEAESAYLGNGSSDAGDLDNGQEVDDEEEEPLAAATVGTGTSIGVGAPADVVDLTVSAAPTPRSVLAVDTALSVVVSPDNNMVIDITSSAAGTPAPAEDTDSDVALAGIFTPSGEDSHPFPPP